MAPLVKSSFPEKVVSGFSACYFYSASLTVAAVSAAVLVTSCANAQSMNSTAPALEGV